MTPIDPAAAWLLNLGFAALRNLNHGPYNGFRGAVLPHDAPRDVQALFTASNIIGAGLENMHTITAGPAAADRIRHELQWIYKQVEALRLPPGALTDERWQTWRDFCDQVAAELERPAVYGIPYPPAASPPQDAAGRIATLHDVVITWMRARNSANRVKLPLVGMLAGILAGVLLTRITEAGLLLAMGVFLWWIFRAPKPITPRELHRWATVPDDLLAAIAGAPTLPTAAKERVADLLRRNSQLTFDDLRDVDNHLAAERADAVCKTEPGYIALLNHSSPPSR